VGTSADGVSAASAGVGRVVLPDVLTYGLMLDIACKVTTPEEGADLLRALVARAQQEDPTLTNEVALTRCRANLGYLAGYCNVETQRRFEVVFSAVHPVFGAVGGPAEPKTAAETFAMGVARGTQC
jgi:hypothetical protein